MIINILGYNIFSKGGTSRSNINLIKSLLNSNHEVHYFNYIACDNNDIMKLLIHEGLSSKDLKISAYNSNRELSMGDLLIITRESFFQYSKDVKRINRNIKIMGEIHGPLKYINDDIDLSLETIDCIRVSTSKIKEAFRVKYDYHNVFNQYVNAGHIDLQIKPINTKRNFMIKSRFEDDIKDISYVIKLFNYIIKNNLIGDIKLYIIGYGPSELLYKNLINYYGLQDYVFINSKEPKSYIYISSSPYETLGYSILETIAKGNKALVYYGDDKVLKDIYGEYNAIEFLTKDLSKDSKVLNHFLNYKYNEKDRLEDYQKLKHTFIDNDYGKRLLENINRFPINTKIKIKRRKNNLYRTSTKTPNLTALKENKIIRFLLKNRVLANKLKNYYQMRQKNKTINKLNSIPVNSNYVL